jgi:FKBP-type peptidyl-prolyl cis-trans isomerase 2
VSIHYRGFLLDGTTFDSSYTNQREEPVDPDNIMESRFKDGQDIGSDAYPFSFLLGEKNVIDGLD